FIVTRQRRIEFALETQTFPASAIGAPIIGLECNGLAVVLNGAVELAAVDPDLGALVERRRVFRRDPDGLVEIPESLVVVSFAIPGIAAMEVGCVIIRIERDRGIEIADRSFEFALAVQGKAAKVEREGPFGIENDRLIQVD